MTTKMMHNPILKRSYNPCRAGFVSYPIRTMRFLSVCSFHFRESFAK